MCSDASAGVGRGVVDGEPNRYRTRQRVVCCDRATRAVPIQRRALGRGAKRQQARHRHTVPHQCARALDAARVRPVRRAESRHAVGTGLEHKGRRGAADMIGPREAARDEEDPLVRRKGGRGAGHVERVVGDGDLDRWLGEHEIHHQFVGPSERTVQEEVERAGVGQRALYRLLDLPRTPALTSASFPLKKARSMSAPRPGIPVAISHDVEYLQLCTGGTTQTREMPE